MSNTAVTLTDGGDPSAFVGTQANPLVVTPVTGGAAVPTQVVGNVASGVTDSGNPVKVGAKFNATPPTFVDGQRGDLQIGSRGAVAVTLFQQNSSNAAVFANPGNAMANNGGLVTVCYLQLYNGATTDEARSIQGSDGTGLGINAVAIAPQSAATGAITPSVTATVNSAQTVKASAGNLYGFNVVNGASAGFVMVFNAATAPADGTVTPIKVYAMAANSSLGVVYDIPLRFSTGITIVFSTTGPFTKTASATAFISGDAA